MIRAEQLPPRFAGITFMPGTPYAKGRRCTVHKDGTHYDGTFKRESAYAAAVNEACRVRAGLPVEPPVPLANPSQREEQNGRD